MSRAPVEIVVAALIRDESGRVLLVRKRGTDVFMQPGGKREPGEDDLTALGRELAEELGCRMVAGCAVRVGAFRAEAANEPDREVVAAVYAVDVDGPIAPQAEIVEVLWVDPARLPAVALAPLTLEHILPLVAR
jgi:8-oxo-dGTP diphosphatase